MDALREVAGVGEVRRGHRAVLVREHEQLLGAVVERAQRLEQVLVVGARDRQADRNRMQPCRKIRRPNTESGSISSHASAVAVGRMTTDGTPYVRRNWSESSSAATFVAP